MLFFSPKDMTSNDIQRSILGFWDLLGSGWLAAWWRRVNPHGPAKKSWEVQSEKMIKNSSTCFNMFQQFRPCFIVSYHFPTCSHRVSPFFHHESSAARCLEARAGGRPAPLRQHYGGMAPCLGDDKMGRIIICIYLCHCLVHFLFCLFIYWFIRLSIYCCSLMLYCLF